jgi:hypothetical protein
MITPAYLSRSCCQLGLLGEEVTGKQEKLFCQAGQVLHRLPLKKSVHVRTVIWGMMRQRRYTPP